jgi:hypothetical protein
LTLDLSEGLDPTPPWKRLDLSGRLDPEPQSMTRREQMFRRLRGSGTANYELRVGPVDALDLVADDELSSPRSPFLD